VERWCNFTDRGEWSVGGIVMTVNCGALWNCTDGGDWSAGGIILIGEWRVSLIY
jgi:hypothetical protein